MVINMAIRVTNKMMTNNLLTNINSNKIALNKLDEQYATGLKIQRPSDDPVVAVRALKLRTNLAELNQYYEKNIPDAFSWMDVTEGALNEVNDLLTEIHSYCVQGSTDTLTEKDRNSIAETLGELKQQIYQEGGANYAGRYVFTGYKTDTNLIFDTPCDDYCYNITEPVSGKKIDIFKRAENCTSLTAYDAEDPENFEIENMPNITNGYRLRLSYDDLDLDDAGDGILAIQIPVTDADGNYEYDDEGNIIMEDYDVSINTKTSLDADAYIATDYGTINFIADTGELILSEDVYLELKNVEDINISYQKSSFEKNELRPEHYFDCSRTLIEDGEDAEAIVFEKQDQNITYEINFNQRMTINTQGSDAITHTMGRVIDEIIDAVDSVNKCTAEIKEVEKMLSDGGITKEQKEALTKLKESLDSEYVIKTSIMQDMFSKALTETEQQQDIVNAAVADLGARYVRLELTESRLSSEQVDFEDLLSSNEDADLVDTVVRFNAQQTIYNAALSAASKVVQNTLLDFL